MKNYLIYTLTFLFSLQLVQADFDWENHYDFTSIPNPEGVDPQCGGLALTSDGKLIACFHRGEVMIYDFTSKKWSLFADGLHEPLGVHVEEDGRILVIQRPELTRLHDTDNDGVADFYETVCDDWGMSGNYHEFVFGPVKDSQKNIYIALGTASNGSGVRDEIRGSWNDAGGLTHERFTYNDKTPATKWTARKEGIPRMYARVPYRGCVLKIKPGNRKAEVYATGVRTPNGLYIDKNDQLWISDNQGDWVGASSLNRIEEGQFHGHVASLLWDPKNPVTDAIPVNIPIEELDTRRVKGAGLFPQGEAGNSITQPINLNHHFAPIEKESNSMLIGEMNHSRLIHYFKDKVNGKVQGAGCHFFSGSPIGSGNNRLVYSTDGKSLILGKTHLSWPGRDGLKKVTFNGTPYLMVKEVNLTPTGFKFTFNAPISSPGAKENYLIEHYSLKYSKSYGSKNYDVTNVGVSELRVDGNVLYISFTENPIPNKIYDITLPAEIKSDIGNISSRTFWYSAHEVYK